MSLAVGLNLFNTVNTIVFSNAACIVADTLEGTYEHKIAEKVKTGTYIASAIAAGIKALSILGTGAAGGAVFTALTVLPVASVVIKYNPSLIKNKNLRHGFAICAAVSVVASVFINFGAGIHPLISQPYTSGLCRSGRIVVLAHVLAICQALTQR